MKKVLFLLSILLFATALRSQTIINRDPKIGEMVNSISRDNIESYINTMVGFHTRHNLSVQDDQGKGIGAAWTWVKAEMEKSIPASGGRLSVEFVDYSVGGEGQRIKDKTGLKNVVATLKGTDPSDTRIFLVSAHLDSRVEGDADNTTFAPGANDDGSGVAAILEMIRIMSPHPFGATIRFMVVTGEEHGLLGASHMASLAKEENWNVMLC
ncbi:MAG: M20/M25/M40 family metallo-hydrolase [Bacteroidales bacterium]